MRLVPPVRSCRFAVFILGTAVLLTASACGSDAGPALTDPGPGDESPTDPPPPRPGIFLDAAVWGLSFQSGQDLTGTTDQSGAFEYVAGEELRFFLGGVELGTVPAGGEVVTPNDFAVPENIARFLQSLDEDQDPANGIDVRRAAAILAGRTIPSTVFANANRASFETDPAIVDALLAVGADLVDADEALAHLDDTLSGGFTIAELADQTFVLMVNDAVGVIVFDALADPQDNGSTGFLVLSDEVPGSGDEFTWNVSNGFLTIDEGGTTSQLSRAGTSERAISAIRAPNADDPSPEPVTMLRPVVLTEEAVSGEPISVQGSKVRTLAMAVGGQAVEFEYRSDGSVSGSGVAPLGGIWSVNEYGPFLKTIRGTEPAVTPNTWTLSLLLDGSLGVQGELLRAEVTFTGEDPVSGDPLLTWNTIVRTAFTRVDDVVLSASDSCADVPTRTVATFADPALAAKIRFDLGLPEQADLTCGVLTEVRTLFPSPEVGSLVGIQNLPRLAELSLNGTGVTDLGPLVTVPWLTSLQISNSPAITGFSAVSALTGLTSLRVSSSGVTDRDVREMLPTELTSLTRLQLDRNSITDLQLPLLPNVTWFDASFNQLTDVERIGRFNRDLTVLNLNQNAISDISGMSAIRSVDSLYLTGNDIGGISPVSFGGTTVAHLAGNRIQDLTPLAAGTGLIELSLTSNEIFDASPLSDLFNLKVLRIGANELYRIVYIDGEFNGFFGSVLFLENLDALEILELNSINMRDSFGLRFLPSDIRQLNLNGNFIGTTSQLERLTSLERLELNGNAPFGPPTTDLRPDSLNLEGLVGNGGIGAGDWIDLGNNFVDCSNVAALRAKGAVVVSDCPS